MKRLALILTILIIISACEKSERIVPVPNPIYPEDLNPLQGEWENDTLYFSVNDKSIVLDVGDTIVYHGTFWFLDNRGMILELEERGMWQFNYELWGEDSLWFNYDTISTHSHYKYINLLFIRK